MEAEPGSDPVRGVIGWGHFLLPFVDSRRLLPTFLPGSEQQERAHAAWERFSTASQLQFAGDVVSFPPKHLQLLHGILRVLLHIPQDPLFKFITQKVPKPSSSQLQPSALGWFDEEGAALTGNGGKDWNPLGFASEMSQEM